MNNQETTERQKEILKYITFERAITIREIQENLKIGFTTAERLLNNMVIDGTIERKTKTFNGRNYFIYISKETTQPTP